MSLPAKKDQPSSKKDRPLAAMDRRDTGSRNNFSKELEMKLLRKSASCVVALSLFSMSGPTLLAVSAGSQKPAPVLSRSIELSVEEMERTTGGQQVTGKAVADLAAAELALIAIARASAEDVLIFDGFIEFAVLDPRCTALR
jgi:hypothetical protein